MNRQLIGQVNVFAFDFVPADWVACNGQLLSIQKFSELFSLIGTNFGGDGTSSFGVPDFKSHGTGWEVLYGGCWQCSHGHERSLYRRARASSLRPSVCSPPCANMDQL